jgi:hypothetical protein
MKRTHNNNKRTRRFQALIIALFLVVTISPQCVFGGESSSSSDTTVTTVSVSSEESADSDVSAIDESVSDMPATDSADAQQKTNTETEAGEIDASIDASSEQTTQTTVEANSDDDEKTTEALNDSDDNTEENTDNDEQAVSQEQEDDVATAGNVVKYAPVVSAALASTAAVPPDTSKTITDNGDGTYNINLSVTGKVSTTSESSKFNVVVVADTSASMSRDKNGNSAVIPTGGYPATKPNTDYDSKNTRLKAEKDALIAFGDAFQELNTDSNDPTVKLGLVSFGTVATDHGIFTEFGEGSDYRTTVNNLSTASETPSDQTSSYMGATNWEDALQMADSIDFDNDYPTYVVFISDGDPTVRNSQHGGYTDEEYATIRGQVTQGMLTYMAMDPEINVYPDYQAWFQNTPVPNDTRLTNTIVNGTTLGVYGNGVGETYFAWTESTTIERLTNQIDVNEDYYPLNYHAGLTAAKAITEHNKTFYTVGVYNDVTRMAQLCSDVNGSTDNYYAVADAEEFSTKLKSLAETIKTSSSYKNVKIHDHITGLTSADIKVDGASTDEFTYTITDSTGTHEWTEAENATTPVTTVSSDGEVIFNPSSVLEDGILADGVTYTVSFRVWPDQDALDTVAKLNNGETVSYDTTQILAPDSTHDYYRLKTNVDAYDSDGDGTTDIETGTYVEYTSFKSTTTTPGGGSTETGVDGKAAIANPDPIPLWDTTITITKTWVNADPDDENIKSITLNLIQDGDTENPYISGITLTKGSDGVWKAEKHVAVGLIARDPADLKDSSIEEKTRQILEDGHDYTLDEITITYNDGTTKTPVDADFEFSTDSVHPMLDDWEKEKQSDGTYNLLDYTVVNLTNTDPITVDSNWSYELKTTNTKTITDTDVPLKKIDSKTKNVLSGAEFSLYKATVNSDGNWTQGDAVKTGITTGSDGTFTLTGLVEGKYLLVETKTPAGYQEPTHEWRITVSEGDDGLTATVQAYEDEDGQWTTVGTDTDGNNLIENVPVDYNLPSTGGLGSLPFLAAGSAILAFAAALYIFITKSKKEGS